MDEKSVEVLNARFSVEFGPEMKKMSNQELRELYSNVSGFLRTYASGYELERDMYLVLDNNIVQDFKHKTSPGRGLRATSYTAFCRFVNHWGDRKSYLGISPVILYEHNGRKPSSSPDNALSCYQDVQRLLAPCNLPLAMVGFADPRSLHIAMNNVHADADYLEVFATQIEGAEWERDLSAHHGGETLAIAVAERVIPDDMPLRYFDPNYIKRVFSSRIEQRIVDQSKGVLHKSPIRSGEISIALAKLNALTKKGVLQGLGDIDLLQICDVGRQYKQGADYLLLGQTYDDDLKKALRLHHRMVKGVSVVGGSRNVGKQIENTVKFMFSKPFARHDEVLEKILLTMRVFSEHLAGLCRGFEAENDAERSNFD